MVQQNVRVLCATQPSPSVSTLRPEATPRPSIPQTPAVLQAFAPHDTTYLPGSDSGHSDSRFEGINRMFILYGPIKAYLILYMPLYRVLDSAIRPRNLDPDFEETHESSDSSEDSEDEDQSETNAMHPGVEEGSKEDSQVFDLSVEANDDPSKFDVLESDAENDDGDDDDQSDDVAEVESVQLPVPPEMRFDDRLLSSLGGMENIASGAVPDKILKEMGGNGWSELATHTPYDYLQEPYEPRSPASMREDYPHLYSGDYGPTSRALAAAATPSGAFFYFLQPQLWENIAAESTEYFLASIDERVEGQHAKQVARERKHNEYNAKSREAIRENVLKAPPIEARELCVFIGLLIARSIVPNKEKLANHWKTREEGAIPRGCFGRFMTRDRFMHISRNLHFSPNDDPKAMTDRAWKLRPVIDALQERFAAGYTPPAIMAFDEAMLPSRSTFNRMRVFEVYCGKKERAGQTSSTDHKSGPAALARNLRLVFGPTAPPNGEMRLVVMDRFYSSVPLSMQLLTMGFYSIGTVRTDRQGLSTKLIPKKKKGDKNKPPKIPKNKPANIERGTFIVADSLHVPAMRVLRW
ncbi:unnamed protein product [Phytophthora fragariaefolia]|uniref:Unnamed protein product n=1 Tax=Phytophthora fragariaefolia TaxID=1490495 RepID=A0A9W7D9D8_9STRA|nr:unnamed protein product [Phytophthora fragariaefolia]